MHPSNIAEDDRLRSGYVRELIQRADAAPSASDGAAIPRVICQFWHDRAAIPRDVIECLNSWEPLVTQGFKRLLFDDDDARRFIAKRFRGRYVAAFDRCQHPAMRSDYFRLCYMYELGGFYVDADEVYQGADCQGLLSDTKLKVQPLCYDALRHSMVEPAEFLRNGADSPSWTFYINNNPLIAPANHPVIRLALTRSTRLLLRGHGGQRDIQSITGPGNLTASLVKYATDANLAGQGLDFVILSNWNDISISRWPLSYRQDDRNWRLWRAN
jgi:hypothetical protein